MKQYKQRKHESVEGFFILKIFNIRKFIRLNKAMSWKSNSYYNATYNNIYIYLKKINK